MNTTTFFFEDDNNEEVNFNGKTLTFHCKGSNSDLLNELSKFKSSSFCVGRRYRRTTTNVYGDITSKGSERLIGFCSLRER